MSTKIPWEDIYDMAKLMFLIYDYMEKWRVTNFMKLDHFIENNHELVPERDVKLLLELQEKYPEGELLKYYTNSADLQCLVGKNPCKKRITIVFRGTDGFLDCLYDILIIKKDIGNGVRVHRGFYDQLLIKPEIRAKYSTSSRGEFIAGVGFNHETLDRSYFTLNPIFNSPYIFIQHDSKPTENLNIIIGARFDSHNEYKSQFSPKLAFRHQFNNQFSVSGSLGYGFKAPDFRQLYFDFTNTTIGYTVLGYNAVSTAIPILQQQGQIANLIIPVSEFENELKPESSVAVNIGADYDLNQNLKFEFNFFRNSIKNLNNVQLNVRKL